MSKKENDYAQMQINLYEHRARLSKFEPGKVEIDSDVVGSFNEHDKWDDYDKFLFTDKVVGENKIALDFACGPGRNIIRLKDKFLRIDGVDLSPKNLENAKVYTSVLSKGKRPVLYLCNGLDLRDIPDNHYDSIFSTIAFQHICCHSIRCNYLKEFQRVLKDGGVLAIQMGCGITKPYPPNTTSISYHSNFYEALTTNGECDTRVESEKEILDDLNLIGGYSDFSYEIGPAGPGDNSHPQWIYWMAKVDKTCLVKCN